MFTDNEMPTIVNGSLCDPHLLMLNDGKLSVKSAPDGVDDVRRRERRRSSPQNGSIQPDSVLAGRRVRRGDGGCFLGVRLSAAGTSSVGDRASMAVFRKICPIQRNELAARSPPPLSGNADWLKCQPRSLLKARAFGRPLYAGRGRHPRQKLLPRDAHMAPPLRR